jgi:hypothetical protein
MDIEVLNYHINHDKWAWYRLMDPTFAHRFVDDFCESLDDGIRWDVAAVEAGSGSATYTCTDAVNGVLLLQNDDADNDSLQIARLCECWKLVDGYPLYAEIRFQVNDATQLDMFFGLVTGQAWFTAPNDYVVFHKDDGDANIDFTNALNGTATTVDTGQDLEDDTWIILGFHWDGDATLRWFVFRDSDRYCLATGTSITNIVQDEELTLAFGVQNGEAVAKSMQVDYVKCVQKRVRE